MARKSRKEALAHPPVPRWRTALYARLSFLEEPKESHSIENQLLLLKSFLETKPELTLTAIYTDTNQSGTHFDRPGFRAMMDAAAVGSINCIAVKDLSRFGRNYLETGEYLERLLPLMGVRFLSVTDEYDSAEATPSDAATLLALKNLMHDAYARDISQKTRSALAAKRRRGEFAGSIAPYGYQKKAGGILTVDDNAAIVVRSIFQWADQKESLYGIAKQLNASGIPSPACYRYERGFSQTASSALWHTSTLKRIVTNPVYLGHMAQGKTKSILQEKNRRTLHAQADWTWVLHTHAPLVAEEVFFRIQQRFSLQGDENHCMKRRP